jgi:uncharacterized protein YijF (DUF1287 family)
MKRYYSETLFVLSGLLLALVPGTPTSATPPSTDPPHSLSCIADADNVELVGYIDTPGLAQGVAIAGGYAYIADGDSGLRVVDVSTPSHPTEVGFYDTPGSARDVAIAGNYAYVADDNSGLRVIDVSTPANPVEIGSYKGAWFVMGVKVVGNYAYIVENYNNGLRILDVSTPANPTTVGFYDEGRFPEDVAIAGSYAYISAHNAAGTAALIVVDVSTLSNPRKVGFCEWPGASGGVDVSGSYAYVAAHSGGLRVADISTPSSPTEVSLSDTLAPVSDVTVANGYAYVAGRGVRVLDISNPLDLTEVGFYYMWSASDVAVAGGYVYATNGGLFILRYTGAGVVSEARADIGMPYSAYRGCPSPYVGCGGPYHGFYYGVCTDLAMDAYDAGVPFNLQDALYRDHQAHPGRYRYRTARNAEDMRRYFNHNQQWLPHSQAYQPGDIAFFDWDANGLCDHVGVVSEVDAGDHPTRMVHAPGVCSVNPSGRAFEQDWNSHYDQHIQGHGRLSETGSLLAPADDPLQLLRITVDSPAVTLSLRDANGKFTSATYDENLVASGVEASIPYIPGGWYTDRGGEQVITVTWPLSNTSQYFVELTGQSAVTYHLRIEALQGASVTDSQVFTRTIATGETHGSAITLSAYGGTIQFSATSPAPSPLLGVPESLTLAGLVGTSAQGILTVTETGGQQPLQNVTISATDLMDSLGGTVSGSLLSISPDSFTVPAVGSESVDAQVSLSNVAPGTYRGALMIRTDNAGTEMVPLTLEVQFHQVYLPTVLKSY